MENPTAGFQIEKLKIKKSLHSKTFLYEKIPFAQYSISDTSVNEK